MAPPQSVAAKTTAMARRGSHLSDSRSGSRELTPTAPKQILAKSPLGTEEELAAMFRSDLTSIRGLVTCSICDQLLYEPWTLSCGHTYCYSCLCSWFVPNKQKKTCPECRTKVKQMPAPSFMIKQMVEIFTKRIELMPADESVEQHTQKRAEEIADVENDRNSAEGLFKGTFPEPQPQLLMDEEDGVMRCIRCGHEHEGGPTCQNCGLDFDEDDLGFLSHYDESDLEDLDDLEQDLVDEVEDEFVPFPHHRHIIPAGSIPTAGLPPRFMQYHLSRFHHHIPTSPLGSDSGRGEESEGDNDSDDSLDGFVAPDDESPDVRPRRRTHPRQPITISDDESDEGGPVTNIRTRRTGWVSGRSTPPRVAIDLTESEDIDITSESEGGDLHGEAEMLRQAGWSPLHQGDESEVDDHVPIRRHREEFDATDDDSGNNDGYSTDTTIGNAGHGEDYDFQSRESLSSATPDSNRYPSVTPTREPEFDFRGRVSNNPWAEFERDVGNRNSNRGGYSFRDIDGDSEMSPSPSAFHGMGMSMNDHANYPESRSSRAASTDNGYNNEDTRRNEGRGVNLGTNGDVRAQELGEGHQINELDDDSFDGPITRRRPRRHGTQTSRMDSRVAARFTEPDSFREVPNHGVNINTIDLTDDDDDLMPLSRNALAYLDSTRERQRRPASTSQDWRPKFEIQERQQDPLRSTRSPSVTRIIASSSRTNRSPRRYVNSYHR